MKIVRRDIVDDSHLQTYVSDPIIRQILARRGIKSESEVTCQLSDIYHYRDLHDIDKASNIIADAIENGDKILVSGDYDVVSGNNSHLINMISISQQMDLLKASPKIYLYQLIHC